MVYILRLPRLTLVVPQHIRYLVHCHTCGLPHFCSNMVHMSYAQSFAKSCHFVVVILLATLSVADTLCLSLVVAKLVMNLTGPWPHLLSHKVCGSPCYNRLQVYNPLLFSLLFSLLQLRTNTILNPYSMLMSSNCSTCSKVTLHCVV